MADLCCSDGEVAITKQKSIKAESAVLSYLGKISALAFLPFHPHSQDLPPKNKMSQHFFFTPCMKNNISKGSNLDSLRAQLEHHVDLDYEARLSKVSSELNLYVRFTINNNIGRKEFYPTKKK